MFKTIHHMKYVIAATLVLFATAPTSKRSKSPVLQVSRSVCGDQGEV